MNKGKRGLITFSILVLAIPTPNPPNVKAGLIIAGKPICLRSFYESLI